MRSGLARRCRTMVARTWNEAGLRPIQLHYVAGCWLTDRGLRQDCQFPSAISSAVLPILPREPRLSNEVRDNRVLFEPRRERQIQQFSLLSRRQSEIQRGPDSTLSRSKEP